MNVDKALSFLRAIQKNLADVVLRHVFGDWLEDEGCNRWESLGLCHPISWMWSVRKIDNIVETGIIRGIGRGRGSGLGVGRGFAEGRWAEYREGVSDKRGGSLISTGKGRGSGIGIGRGIGIARGSGKDIVVISGGPVIGDIYMEIGKAYLVHCGDWHTFVGRCVGMISPVVYLMEGVSKICETNNGDNWHLLAAGDEAARKKATYAHYTTNMVVPLAIGAFEWLGRTPQECGLK